MEATLRKTGALLGKDLKDVVKNPTMLVCCLLPVGFMLFYKNAVGGGMEGEQAEAFSSMLVSWSLLFTATMVASMATLNAIAEEKEKRTLRTLMLANVSAEQMLASRGLVTLLAIGVVDAACYLVIGQPPAGLPAFLAIGMAGSVPIVLLSLLLGLVARDQMSAGVLSMPILIAGIAPMFAQMVDGLSDIAPYLPTGGMNELGLLLARGELLSPDAIMPVATTLAWVAVAAVAFALLYRRLARDN
ncbi:ABC transporter permease [Gordonibacter urolithinfaciens]|uniref:ABC transporter permease n=1 Tax=Gordonibacter urolithinfaciens TaxID=1335613 RepID=UPI0034AC73C6